jgi:ribokinase
MGQNVSVYGLGQCCIDYLGRINRYPEPDEKCEFTNLVTDGGGPVATALVALSRWGMSCSIAGVVGDDRFGAEIRRGLEREGVDCADLIVRDNAESQFAFIVAEPGVGRRTIFWRRPTGAPPRPDEIDLDAVRRARVLHTDGLFPEASLAAARAAHESGVDVVVDAGSVREGMLELARSSHHFIASSTFAGVFAPGAEPAEVCRRLADLGPRVTGVTVGPRGYVGFADGRVFERDAYRVDSIDATGCGDIFHAGYTYGLLQRWPVEKRFDFGAWSAAQVSCSLGGRFGIPDVREYPGVRS